MFAKPCFPLFIVSIIMLMSCTGKESGAQQVKPKIIKQHKEEKMVLLDTASLGNLSAEQAIVKFGKPLQQDSFDLSIPLSEFRIEIYNHIPEKDRHSSAIKIKEYTWPYGTTDRITAWYQQKQDKWVFLHYNIWPQDATF